MRCAMCDVWCVVCVVCVMCDVLFLDVWCPGERTQKSKMAGLHTFYVLLSYFSLQYYEYCFFYQPVLYVLLVVRPSLNDVRLTVLPSDTHIST